MIALLVILVVLLVVFPIVGFAVWALISALIVGAILGGLARLLLPGRQDIGFFATIVFGWIGSLVGGFIARHLLHLHSNILTVLVEIGVAMVLVLVAVGPGNLVARRDRTMRF